MTGMSEKKQERSYWHYKGKPLKVLSTSMGLVLLANLAFTPLVIGETAAPSAKLVEWSSDEVKAFFDPSSDWNMPLPVLSKGENVAPTPTPTNNGGSSGSGSTIVHTGGFGWDDLLLYHLIFNRGGVYSSSQYYANRPAYVFGSGSSYKPKSYDNSSFQNKTKPNSQVAPKTSNSTGSIVRRGASAGNKSTSSTSGGIGGKSSGIGSSSSGSSGSSSSSGSIGSSSSGKSSGSSSSGSFGG
ncbi:hypothetical protein NV379_07455 [Paenibacillus sp. N1-5-1-14]|uniref:hypothetical protein n=1 Tax=Paenibacillus radicibacter TaxID=2972488 RepID=UPI0021595962|nr:hypothetical protein [Paenibacillus radicibacter]MCR8642498.1 hypothetical protein [Paenibacillus radicibacter]